MLRSHHPRNGKRSKHSSDLERSESDFGTKSYRDALQRAFNNAKQQIFFNPDMDLFITLTYAKVDNTVAEVLHDVKIFVKSERRRLADSNPAGSGRGSKLKYIFVMEYQKRGSIHVHMIANRCFSLQVNRNGYRELTYWQKGFSSVLDIKDFDSNFRPHLYLFKYMKKAQRIGNSFIHSSRNLNNSTVLTDSEINLMQWRTLTQEYTHTTVNTTNFSYFTNYLEFDDTIVLPTKQGTDLWLEQVKSHSMKELEKLAKNHSKHSS